MAGRRNIPSSLERRTTQSPGMIRHAPLPTYRLVVESQPRRPESLENKIAYQTAEIKQLAGDNHRLAASQVELRQDLVAAEEQVETVKAHMRSIQTETDIQIRGLLDKIAKKEAQIAAGEGLKKELQKALVEARTLAEDRNELSIRIRQATDELHKARAGVNVMPDFNAELDSLRQEHQRLRATFEREKGINTEQVEQMKAMEKDTMGMAKEVERLRLEVLNAEKKAHASNPRSGGYMNPDSLYTATVPGAGVYVDGYRRPYASIGIRPLGEGIDPYASSSIAAVAAVGTGVPTIGGGPIWGAAYNPLLDTASGGVDVPTTGSS